MKTFLKDLATKLRQQTRLLVIVVASVIGCTIAICLQNHSKVSAAPLSCSVQYGDLIGLGSQFDDPTVDEWDSGGYHYEIHAFDMNYTGSYGGSSNPTYGEELDSWSCSGRTQFSDLVNAHAGNMQWNGFNGAGVESPVHAWLGVPAFPGLGPVDAYGEDIGNNNGLWQEDYSVPNVPADNPPAYQNDYSSSAALIDDGASADVAGGSGNQQLFCAGIGNGNVMPGGNTPNCPDITTYPGVLGGPSGPGNPASGSGYLFTQANCAQIITGCTAATLSWYTDQDINDLIGTAADGTINDFYLHMAARNTEAGGWGANVEATLVYPIVGITATCSGANANVSVTAPAAFSPATVNYSSSTIPPFGTHIGNTFTVANAGANFQAFTTIAGTTISSARVTCKPLPTIKIIGTPTCTTVQFTASDTSDPSGDPITAVSVTNDNDAVHTAPRVGAGTNPYTFTISDWEDFQKESFTIHATDSGGTSTLDFTLAVSPCANFVCNNLNPPAVDSTSSFNVDVQFGYQKFGQYGVQPTAVTSNGSKMVYQATPAPPGISPTNMTINGVVGSGVSAYVDATLNNQQLSTPRSYTQSVTFSNYPGVPQASCGGRAIVSSYYPYMKVYGGDVSVGGGFNSGSTSCSDASVNDSNANAGVYGWIKNNASPFSGAGSEFGTLAPGTIGQFASGQGGGTGDSLAFANFPVAAHALPPSNYGGGFGATPCIRDYFSEQATYSVPSTTNTLTCSNAGLSGGDVAGGFGVAGPKMATTGDLGAYITAHAGKAVPDQAGQFYYFDVTNTHGAGAPINCQAPSGLWIQTSTILTGQQATIFVKGNVLIDGGANPGNDVTYSPGSGSWTLATMPSLKLIVQGDIYVDTNTNELDGLYVAEPDSSGNGGTIYDCSQDQFLQDPPGTSKYGSCTNQQLVVNGAFIAETFEAMRPTSASDVGKSNTDPVGAGSCLTAAACPNMAEVFNYGPEVWLPTTTTTTTGAITYAAVESLPPVP